MSLEKQCPCHRRCKIEIYRNILVLLLQGALMKMLLVTTLLLNSAIALAAPFADQYGKYEGQSCFQKGNYTLVDICKDTNQVSLSANGPATSLGFFKGTGIYLSGIVGLTLQDSSTNPKATFIMQKRI
jgi:hypothetical protein